MRTPSARLVGRRRATAGGAMRRPDRRSSPATSTSAAASVSHCAAKAPAIATPIAAAAMAVTSHRSCREGRNGMRLFPGRLDLLEQTLEDAVGVAAFELELGRGRDAVAQRRERHALYIVGGDEVAPGEERRRARRADERNAAPRAGAGNHARPGARRAHQADGIV